MTHGGNLSRVKVDAQYNTPAHHLLDTSPTHTVFGTPVKCETLHQDYFRETSEQDHNPSSSPTNHHHVIHSNTPAAPTCPLVFPISSNPDSPQSLSSPPCEASELKIDPGSCDRSRSHGDDSGELTNEKSRNISNIPQTNNSGAETALILATTTSSTSAGASISGYKYSYSSEEKRHSRTVSLGSKKFLYCQYCDLAEAECHQLTAVDAASLDVLQSVSEEVKKRRKTNIKTIPNLKTTCYAHKRNLSEGVYRGYQFDSIGVHQASNLIDRNQVDTEIKSSLEHQNTEATVNEADDASKDCKGQDRDLDVYEDTLADPKKNSVKKKQVEDNKEVENTDCCVHDCEVNCVLNELDLCDASVESKYLNTADEPHNVTEETLAELNEDTTGHFDSNNKTVIVADVHVSEVEFNEKNQHKDCNEGTTSDSLSVNIDSDSVLTLADAFEDLEFCTQFSDGDSDDESDTLAINDDVEEENKRDSSCTLVSLKEAFKDFGDPDNKGEFEENLTAETDEFKSAYDLKKQFSESDNSIYDSFYSFTTITEPPTSPPVKRVRKPLRWTPRILAETRLSSKDSCGTFSSVASFYTAETSGTFFSARSFQLESCENFQTCEDFQKLNPEIKSKFSKAKDALSRGKDFVKAKFENYRKRLPNLKRPVVTNPINSNSICHRSCAFSCVHVRKDISQYSIPEDNDREGIEVGDAGDESADCLKEAEPTASDNMTLKGEAARNGTTATGDCSEKEVARHRRETVSECEDTGGASQQAGPSSKTQKQTVKTTSNPVGMDTEEDDMPVGTEAISIPRTRKTKETEEAENQSSTKRLRWVSALEKSQGTSLTSSLTSNSRGNKPKLQVCVDQFLQLREMDPESLLTNLGFGAGVHTDESANRIPDRFILSSPSRPGINLYDFIIDNPELHHLLPAFEQEISRQHLQQQQQRQQLDTVDGTSSVATSDDSGSAKLRSAMKSGQSSDTLLENCNANVIVTSCDTSLSSAVAEEDSCKSEAERLVSKSKLLELCGIVPERYLINASNNKTSLEKSTSQEVGLNSIGNHSSSNETGEHHSAEVNKQQNVTSLQESVTKGDYSDQHYSAIEAKEVNCSHDKCEAADDSCKHLEVGQKECTGNAENADDGKELLSAASEDRHEVCGVRSWSSASTDSLAHVHDIELLENETLV